MRRRSGGRAGMRRRSLLLLAALAAGGGCAQIQERLGLGGPPAGPVPVEVPTAAAFMGFDRILRAPAEPDGRFELVVFPDSAGSRTLPDGASAVLLDLTGAGVIRRIRVSLASADPHWLRRIALRMYCGIL